jgi:hypothetical protein
MREALKQVGRGLGARAGSGDDGPRRGAMCQRVRNLPSVLARAWRERRAHLLSQRAGTPARQLPPAAERRLAPSFETLCLWTHVDSVVIGAWGRLPGPNEGRWEEVVSLESSSLYLTKVLKFLNKQDDFGRGARGWVSGRMTNIAQWVNPCMPWCPRPRSWTRGYRVSCGAAC